MGLMGMGSEPPRTRLLDLPPVVPHVKVNDCALYLFSTGTCSLSINFVHAFFVGNSQCIKLFLRSFNLCYLLCRKITLDQFHHISFY